MGLVGAFYAYVLGKLNSSFFIHNVAKSYRFCIISFIVQPFHHDELKCVQKHNIICATRKLHIS